jgi:hypothetical protein
MSAAGTLVAMTAERGRAASFDGQQHFPVLPGIHWRLRSKNDCPAMRTTSAISKRGRFI